MPEFLRIRLQKCSTALPEGATQHVAPRLTKCAILIALVMLILGSTVTAQDAIEDGRNALNRDTDYPWYDPDTDSLRPTKLPDLKDPEPDESEVDSSADSSPNVSGSSAFSGFIARRRRWITSTRRILQTT